MDGVKRNEAARWATAEALGTFAIVFAGCGSLMVAERFPGSVANGVVPLVFGLVVTIMVYALGHISGAHFNPAVTIAFALARHFPRERVILYCAAQFIGALLAMICLVTFLPTGLQFGATVPHVMPGQAFFWEIALTFLVMFVVMGVATDTRAVGTMAGAAVGATVTLAAFLGGPLTGASMNPARSFAPALWEGRVDVLWIYLLGPVVGAALAALTYEWLRGAPVPRTP